MYMTQPLSLQHPAPLPAFSNSPAPVVPPVSAVFPAASVSVQQNPYQQSGSRMPQPSSNAPHSIYPPMPMSSPDQSGDRPQVVYQPVAHHWFYSVQRESREKWEPFSVADSIKIEEAFKSGMINNFFKFKLTGTCFIFSFCLDVNLDCLFGMCHG